MSWCHKCDVEAAGNTCPQCGHVSDEVCGKCGKQTSYKLTRLTAGELDRMEKEYSSLFLTDAVSAVKETKEYLSSIEKEIEERMNLAKSLSSVYARDNRKEIVADLDVKKYVCRDCYPTGIRNEGKAPSRTDRLEARMTRAIRKGIPSSSLRFTGLKGKGWEDSYQNPEEVGPGLVDVAEEIRWEIERNRSLVRWAYKRLKTVNRDIPWYTAKELELEAKLLVTWSLTQSESGAALSVAQAAYSNLTDEMSGVVRQCVALRREKKHLIDAIQGVLEDNRTYKALIDASRHLVWWDIKADLWNGKYFEQPEVDSILEEIKPSCELCRKKVGNILSLDLPASVPGVALAVPRHDWKGRVETFHVCRECAVSSNRKRDEVVKKFSMEIVGKIDPSYEEVLQYLFDPRRTEKFDKWVSRHLYSVCLLRATEKLKDKGLM